MFRVIFILFYFLRTSSAGGGGGGCAARRFLLFLIPCSADHEQDWPPCKVVFPGLATNTLNVRNNNYRDSADSQMKRVINNNGSTTISHVIPFTECSKSAVSTALRFTEICMHQGRQ